MSTTALEIQVDANVKNATAGLQDVQKQLANVATQAQKTDSTLDQFGQVLQRFGTSGSQSIALLTGKLETLKAELVNVKDISVLSKFNAEIQSTEKQISQLTNVGKTGFDALGNAVEKTGNPLTKMFSGLRQIAYILPGIGIAGLIGLISGPLIDAFQSWYESATNVSNATKLLQENQANLDAVLKDASKDAGKQTQDLKILYDAATNVNLSMKDRLSAVNALQQAFPEYFGNIRKEAILNGDAKGAYDDLTLSIIANARAKAALAKIQDLGAKLLDSEIKQQKIAEDIQKNIAAQGVAAAKNSKDAELRGLEQFNTDYKGVKLRQQQIDENANNFRLKQEIDFLTKFAGLANLEKQAIDDLNLKAPPKPKKPKTEKEEDPFKIALADLEDNLRDANALVVGQLNKELQNEHDFLEKKKALLERYGKYEGENNLKIAENEKKIRAEQLRFLASQLIPNIQPPKQLDFGKLATEKIAPKIQLFPTDEIRKAGEELNKLQAQLDAVAKTTIDILSPAFDALFNAIATGSGNAFDAFGNALLKAIAQMAIAIAKAAALAALIQLIFPGSSLGQKGFSSIFSQLLGIKGFASGINSGTGGLAIVGEQGPELVNLPRGASVIPNNQISAGMVQPVIFIASSRISGNDIVTSYQRQSATNSRNG